MIFRSLPNKGSFNLGSFFWKSPDPPLWVDSEKNEAPKQKNYKINYQLKKSTHLGGGFKDVFFHPLGKMNPIWRKRMFFIVFPDGLIQPPSTTKQTP